METNQQSSNNQSQPSQAEPQVQEEAKTFADQFARVNKQEKFLAEERKRIDEAKTSRHSRAEVKLMSYIDTVIRSNEFDLIEKLGEQNAVRDFMEEMYQQTGEIPDIKDACEAINNSIALKFN